MNMLDKLVKFAESRGIITREVKDAQFYTSSGLPWLGDNTFSALQTGSTSIKDLSLSSLVMVCVNWFGTTLPEAPLQVVEKDAEGKEEEVFEHKLTELLKRPNPYYAGSLLWAAFALDWFCDGNVYLRKIRNGYGEVIQLWPIPSFLISPHWPKDDPSVFIDYYKYQYDGKIEQIDPADIVHFRNGIDNSPIGGGRRGLAPLKSGLREVYGDMKASAMTAALMANHGIVSYVLSPKNKEDAFDNPTQAEAVKAQFIASTTGSNSGKPILNAIPLDIEKLAFSPKDMDLSDLRMIFEERVPALLGIPPIVLSLIVGLKNATYSNYKQAREMAYEQMVIPSQNYIADELTAQLLVDFKKTTKQRVKFDLTQVRVLQTDMNELVERTCKAYDSGIIMRSTAKTWLGVPVVEGEDDVYESKQPPMTPKEVKPTKEEVDRALADLEKQMKVII